jgi:hypothetical protein
MHAMIDSSIFPLYVYEKDDWSMFLVERPDKVLYDIEPIDFENDEYLFWDAQERSVRLTLKRGKLIAVEEAENEISLREALTRYSNALGATVDTSGPLPEVWAKLQSNVKPLTRAQSIVRNAIGAGCSLIVIAVAIFLLVLVGGVIKALVHR